jgi:hypothetical protein
LEGGRVLKDYGIENESEIYLVKRLIGAGFP